MLAGQQMQAQGQGQGARPTANIAIDTSLPLGRGSVSCDIVVLRRTGADSGKLLYLFATNNPYGVELYHSPEHAFTQVEMPCKCIAAAIKWANSEYKAVDIVSNSRLTNVACDRMIEMQYILRGMASDRGLQPPGLSTRTTVGNLHRATLAPVADMSARNRNRQGKEVGGVVLRLAVEGDMPVPMAMDRSMDAPATEAAVPHAAVLAFETPFVEGGRICVPHPVARTDSDTVNTTVMFLGSAFAEVNACFSSVIDRDVEVPILGDAFWLDGMDVNTCRVVYLSPTPIRLTLGLNCMLSPEPNRTRHYINGTSMTDLTEKRLMMVTGVGLFAIPTACGCAVRDLVHFQRPHIPLLLAPKDGLDYVFEDHPEGVRLTIDGVPSGVIRTAVRHDYDGVSWVDWTRT